MAQYRTRAEVIFAQVPLIDRIDGFMSTEENVMVLSSLASASHQSPLMFREYHKGTNACGTKWTIGMWDTGDDKNHGLKRRWTKWTVTKRDTWVNDKKHGLDRYWYENGQLQYEIPYENGKLHGMMLMYQCWFEHGVQKDVSVRGGVTKVWHQWNKTSTSFLGVVLGRRFGY